MRISNHRCGQKCFGEHGCSLTLQHRSGYETKWFTQSLTHVPSDTRTFRQRYLVETHGNNAVLSSTPATKARSPTSGRARASCTTWERSWAPSCSSRKRATTARACPRTTSSGSRPELILADYANLVTQIVPAESPVVVFGGSYGGTLATFLRLTYPEIFVGALRVRTDRLLRPSDVGAAQRHRGHVGGSRRAQLCQIPLCLDAIAATNKALRRAPFLKKRLRLCDGSALGADHAALFQYALEGYRSRTTRRCGPFAPRARRS